MVHYEGEGETDTCPYLFWPVGCFPSGATPGRPLPETIVEQDEPPNPEGWPYVAWHCYAVYERPQGGKAPSPWKEVGNRMGYIPR